MTFSISPKIPDPNYPSEPVDYEIKTDSIDPYTAGEGVTIDGLKIKNGGIGLDNGTGASKIGAEDGAGGTLWTTVAGFISKVLSSAGAGLFGFSHAETYATGTVGKRLKQSVWVTDAPYNCKVDGATDDTAGYAAALADALTVFIPSGTLLHTQVSVPAGRTVVGIGRTATVLKLKAGTNSDGHTVTNANDIEFRSLTLDGNKANNLTGGCAVRVSGTSSRVRTSDVRVTNWRDSGVVGSPGTSHIQAFSCRFDNCVNDGFSMTTVDYPSAMLCESDSNGRYGAVFGSGCTHVRDIGNAWHDNAGGGSIMVGGSDAIRLGNLAISNGAGHGLQYNATVRGIYAANISTGNGISGLDYTLGSSYGSAVGNISHLNAVRGMEIDSASLYISAIGNVVYRNVETGISVYRSPATALIGNYAGENGSGSVNKFGIRLWDDLNTLPSSNCVLLGNNATDDRGGSATQTTGVSIEAASTSGTRLIANKLDTNLTSGVSAVAGSVNSAQYNLGWITRWQGSASIPAGSTSVVIAHGMSITPIPEDIYISLTSGPTNPVDLPWISSTDATTFTVNVRTDPGAGGLNFRWKCRRY